MGSDDIKAALDALTKEFLSTLPAWGATDRTHTLDGVAIFLSTLPAWGATWWSASAPPGKPISIHAPRVGSDAGNEGERGTRKDISIHAPRVGSDGDEVSEILAERQFLSTLPAWGATKTALGREQIILISIHAPRVGSDAPPGKPAPAKPNFYPRSPRGERQRDPTRKMRIGYFYPRSPRGERHIKDALDALTKEFLSTLPAWGATADIGFSSETIRISIHAPRVGSDSKNRQK